MSDARTKARELLTHSVLGQLDAEEEAWLAEQLAHDATLRDELAAVRVTVGALRRAPRLRPSVRFRQVLDRRLDREEARRPTWTDGVSFRAHFLLHRLRTSPRRQWQLAASLLPLLLGLGWYLQDRGPKPVPDDVVWRPVAESTSADDATPLEEQVFQGPPRLVPDLTPRFVDQETQLPLPDVEHAQESQLVETPVVSGDRSVADAPPPRRTPLDLPTPPEVPAFVAAGGSEEAGRSDGDSSPTSPDRPVRKALRWLLQQQNSNGSWLPGAGEADLDVAVTALALLAFVSDGHLGGAQTDSPLHLRTAVNRAVEYLLVRQSSDGIFGRAQVESFRTETFNHATATLALTELATLRLAARDDTPQTARLAHAVRLAHDELGRRLHRLYERSDRGTAAERRGEGENAAWTALALATAQRSGIDWGLDVHIDQRVEQMFARLRNDRQGGVDVGWAGSRAHAAVRDVLGPDDDVDAWERAVIPVLQRPASTEPALRFLVASAMAPWNGEGSAESWSRYRDKLRRTILDTQDAERGFFTPSRQGGFDGGDVYETSLCVLTLQIAERARSLREAAEELKDR